MEAGAASLVGNLLALQYQHHEGRHDAGPNARTCAAPSSLPHAHDAIAVFGLASLAALCTAHVYATPLAVVSDLAVANANAGGRW